MSDRKNPDASLADVDETAEAAELGIEDASVEQAVEDFDFADFVSGVRPTRRSVTIYAANDLRAAIDELADAIALGEQYGQDMTERRKSLDEAVDHYFKSGRRIVVEARSDDWVAKLRKDAKKQGLDPDKSDDDRLTVLIRQLAQQIVSPTKGVSEAALRKLYENNGPEFNKLLVAMTMANNQQASVMPDFSSKSSAGRSGRRS